MHNDVQIHLLKVTIVTLVLSCTVLEILQLLCAPDPTPIPP